MQIFGPISPRPLPSAGEWWPRPFLSLGPGSPKAAQWFVGTHQLHDVAWIILDRLEMDIQKTWSHPGFFATELGWVTCHVLTSQEWISYIYKISSTVSRVPEFLGPLFMDEVCWFLFDVGMRHATIQWNHDDWESDYNFVSYILHRVLLSDRTDRNSWVQIRLIIKEEKKCQQMSIYWCTYFCTRVCMHLIALST